MHLKEGFELLQRPQPRHCGILGVAFGGSKQTFD